MRIVISGGGIVGMTLARLLRSRGFEPIVFERMPEKAYIRRGYMMGFQGYPPLEELGLYQQLKPQGWPIAPRPGDEPVAVCIEVGKLLHALADGLPVEYEHTVTGLVRADDGRIIGVTAEGPEGSRQVDADLVVACDGMMSPTRQMAGLAADFTPLREAALAFMSPEPGGVSFMMRYLSDNSHIGCLGWPEGSAGWRTCDKVGEEAALAPGVEAVKEMWVRLLPESEKAISGVTSIDQIRYSEPQLLTTPQWWIPGLLLIGDSAHFFGPETGVSSGIGMGDAHALAEAVRQNPNDPDAACRAFETWRAPVVRPMEAMDPGRQRLIMHGEGPRDDERWPPPAA